MQIETGNLDKATGANPRAWFIGAHEDESALLYSHHCEVKWVRHPKGLKKVSNGGEVLASRTVVILLSGRWSFRFASGQELVLSEPGDYVAYEPEEHENEALEDSHLVVIRWHD